MGAASFPLSEKSTNIERKKQNKTYGIRLEVEVTV